MILEDDPRFSPLQNIACAVHAKLDEVLGTEVPWAFGGKHAGRHGQRRRIIWTRAASPVTGSKQAGGTSVGAPTGHVEVRPHVLEETARISIYAETDAARSFMVYAFIAAAGRAFGRDAIFDRAPVGYGESGGDEDRAGETQRNYRAVLTLTVPVQVSELAQKLRPMTGYTDQCGTLQEDGTVKPQD